MYLSETIYTVVMDKKIQEKIQLNQKAITAMVQGSRVHGDLKG